MEKLEKEKYLRVALFSSPDGPADWRGLAVQTKGNDMYGELIFLKTEYENNCAFPKKEDMGVPTQCYEWEWNGGVELEGDDLKEAMELYAKLQEKEEPNYELEQ